MAHLRSSPPAEDRLPSSPPPMFNSRMPSPTSSEPPMFSSDGPAADYDVTNYTVSRLKRKRAGPWWLEGEPADLRKFMKKKRTLARNFDSGIMMMSDEVDVESDNREYKAVKDMDKVEYSFHLELADRVNMNETVYSFPNRELEDHHLYNLALLNQVIHPLPDPGTEAPAEGQYRSMIPEIVLSLESNHLRQLSPAFFNINHLTNVSLRNNRIEELPPQIGRLHNLRSLDLSLNRLSWLPAEILALLELDSPLENLSLLGNPLIEKVDKERFNAIKRSDHQSPTASTEELLSRFPDPADQEAAIWYTKYMEREPNWSRKTFIGRTPPTYYDKYGHRIPQSPKPATHNTTGTTPQFSVAVSTPSIGTYINPPPPNNNKTAIFTPSPQQRTKVRSLFTLSLQTSLNHTTSPQEILSMLGGPDSCPSSITHPLSLAQKNTTTTYSTQRECHGCGKEYVIPGAEWMEFWCHSVGSKTTGREKALGAEILPIRFLGCSWACVPDMFADGDFDGAISGCEL